jgi:hypothetical protein
MRSRIGRLLNKLRLRYKILEKNFTFSIFFPVQNRHHEKYFCDLEIPENFIKDRVHILDTRPIRSNHDVLQLFLFSKILEFNKYSKIEIYEFGTWRGAFIENLLIALPENKKIVYFGYDTYSEFPILNNTNESRTIKKFNTRLRLNSPFSIQELSKIFNEYDGKIQFYPRKGIIDEGFSENLKSADIIFFDMDYGITFSNIFANSEIKSSTIIIVDDYQHPSWADLTTHVNKFCHESRRLPVNISDFFGVPRSKRTQFTYLLVPSEMSHFTSDLNYRVVSKKSLNDIFYKHTV